MQGYINPGILTKRHQSRFLRAAMPLSLAACVGQYCSHATDLVQGSEQVVQTLQPLAGTSVRRGLATSISDGDSAEGTAGVCSSAA